MPKRSTKYDDPRCGLPVELAWPNDRWKQRKHLGELLKGRGVKSRVAEALGLSETSANSTLNKWIRGDTYLSNEYLVRLAWLFNVNVPYLLDQTDSPAINDNSDKFTDWAGYRLEIQTAVDFARVIGPATLEDCQDVFTAHPDWNATPLSFLDGEQRAVFTSQVRRMTENPSVRRDWPEAKKRDPNASNSPDNRICGFCIERLKKWRLKTGECRIAPTRVESWGFFYLVRKRGLEDPRAMPASIQLFQSLSEQLPAGDFRDPWKVIEAQATFLAQLYPLNSEAVNTISSTLSNLCRPAGGILSGPGLRYCRQTLHPTQFNPRELLEIKNGSAIRLDAGRTIPISNGLPSIAETGEDSPT